MRWKKCCVNLLKRRTVFHGASSTPSSANFHTITDARNKPALIALHTEDNKVNQEGTHIYVVKCGLSQLLAMKGVLLHIVCLDEGCRTID